MSALLMIAMAAIAVWLVLTLCRGSGGYGDASGEFSRALAAIAPRRRARRRPR